MRFQARSGVTADLEIGSHIEQRQRAGVCVGWLVALSAAGTVAVLGLGMDWIEWGGVGIMSALALAAGLFAFPVAKRHFVSFGTAVYVAALALFGLAVAAWVVTISGVVLAVLVLKDDLVYSLRDTATRVLGILAAGACYFAIGGKAPLTELGLVDTVRFAAMFVTFGAVTNVFRMLVGDHRNEPLGEYVQWLKTRGVVAELAMLPLSMLMVSSYIPEESATFPLLATVLIVVGAAGKGLWETGQGLTARVEQLKLLNDLGHAVSSTLHLEELMSVTHGLLRERLGVDAICLTLLDDGGDADDECICMADGERTQMSRLRLERSLVRRVIEAGGVIQIGDLTQEVDRYGRGMEDDGDGAQECVPIRSWLGLPLLIGERQIGVLSLQSHAAASLGGEQLRFFETLASRLARVVENIRLHERLQESRTIVGEWNTRLEEEVESRTAKLRAAEEDLAALNRDLERRVEERTRDLKEMQANVVRAGRLAAVGELAAGVAHELNNPLGGILGFAQFDLERLSNTGPDGLRGEEVGGLVGHLSQIEHEVKRCSAIVSNLLAFSEPSGSARTVVDINDVVSATVEIMAEQFRMRGLSIEAHLADSIPGVQGSAAELKQAFMNMALNARDAMETGGRLSLSSAVVDARGENPEVTVRFADEGRGIRAEDLDRIFEPFFTTHEVGQGTGLGLSVSYGIVSEHGGEIEVESTLGVGSTFVVRLPVFVPGSDPSNGGKEDGCQFDHA